MSSISLPAKSNGAHGDDEVALAVAFVTGSRSNPLCASRRRQLALMA